MILLLSIWSGESYACSPAQASMVDAMPFLSPLEDAGATLYPINGMFKVEYGNGYALTEPEFIMAKGGDDVAIEVIAHQQTLNMTAQHILYEIWPTEALLFDETYLLYELHGSELVLLSSFRTLIDEAVLPVAPEVPEFSHQSLEVSLQSSCDGEMETTFSFSFSAGPSNSSLHLYSVDSLVFSHLDTIQEADIGERFYSFLHADSLGEQTIVIENNQEPRDYCFVARYSNEAGEEGDLSPVFCSYINGGSTEDPQKTGCAHLLRGSFGWFGVLLIGMALIRRRDTKIRI